MAIMATTAFRASQAFRRAPYFVGEFQRHSSSVAICDDARAKLRLLYRMIHPDLFYGDVQRSQVNEKSFKLLQDYVSNASQGGPGSSHRTSSMPNHHASYDLQFYIDKKEDGSASDAYAKISLTLPAPSSTSPMVTRRSLNKLFRAVNIEELVCDDAYRDTHRDMPLSLQAFIPLVHEQYLIDLTDTSSPDVSLRTMLAAVHYSRRLRVIFSKDGDKATQSVIGKVTLLQDFVEKCLDECPSELGGLTVGFGGDFRQDAQNGVIWLDSSETPTAWVKYMSNVDLKQFHEALEMRTAVRQLSQQAAASLGVASIRSDDSASYDDGESYESFLLSLLRWTSPTSREYEGVELMVASRGTNDTDVDIDRGILWVSAADSPDHLFKILQKYGPRAEENVRRRRQAAKAEKALVSHVERSLRLRLLSKHPDLEDYRYKAACQKLLTHANDLQVLEGLKLRVGEKNAYVKGRGLVDIAWDFRV